jgi:hypothetical protein
LVIVFKTVLALVIQPSIPIFLRFPPPASLTHLVNPKSFELFLPQQPVHGFKEDIVSLFIVFDLDI